MSLIYIVNDIPSDQKIISTKDYGGDDIMYGQDGRVIQIKVSRQKCIRTTFYLHNVRKENYTSWENILYEMMGKDVSSYITDILRNGSSNTKYPHMKRNDRFALVKWAVGNGMSLFVLCELLSSSQILSPIMEPCRKENTIRRFKHIITSYTQLLLGHVPQKTTYWDEYHNHLVYLKTGDFKECFMKCYKCSKSKQYHESCSYGNTRMFMHKSSIFHKRSI